MSRFIWDENRAERTGVAETVFCENKTVAQLQSILEFHDERHTPILLTRLCSKKIPYLSENILENLQYFEEGRTAFFNYKKNSHEPLINSHDIAIVTAGTSDMAVAIEAQQTLAFYSQASTLIADVGVAGLHRLLNKIQDIASYKIIIAVAGMEGALFSVLAGLVKAPVIAVPTSVGYGVSKEGQAALSSALASCAPGVVTVNIDNGFGAAIAAIKMLNIAEIKT